MALPMQRNASWATLTVSTFCAKAQSRAWPEPDCTNFCTNFCHKPCEVALGGLYRDLVFSKDYVLSRAGLSVEWHRNLIRSAEATPMHRLLITRLKVRFLPRSPENQLFTGC